MIKICMIATISLTLKSFVVETAKHLHEKCGYDITLICSEDVAFAASLPSYIHFIPVHMARGIDASALASIREFKRIFREQKFDLIQYSTPNAACYASIAAKAIKAPIRLYCQWGIRYVGMNGIKRSVFRQIEKMVCRNSTAVRAVSPMNRQFGIDEGLYPPDKVKVIGHGGTIGVDMGDYNIEQKEAWRDEFRDLYGIRPDVFVFGYAGRLSKDKGSNELITAFRQLVNEASVPLRLMLVGDNKSNGEIEPSLMEWIHAAPSVVEVGKIDNALMKCYYSCFDVLVHPTYREGFGMVIQEAGAMGIPTITTRIPGASEVMEDNKSCLLVKPKDATDLLLAMKKLLSHPEKTAALGREAFLRTQLLYERGIMLQFQEQDYLTLMQKLID